MPSACSRPQAPPALEPLAQRRAVDVRHDVVQEPADLARVVEGEDVRVGEAGGDLDFLEKALGSEEGGEPGQQHLERDRALMLAVVSQVHGGHAAAPECAANLIAPGERGLEIGGDVRRHGREYRAPGAWCSRLSSKEGLRG